VEEVAAAEVLAGADVVKEAADKGEARAKP
jgi:hypothetical protein